MVDKLDDDSRNLFLKALAHLLFNHLMQLLAKQNVINNTLFLVSGM